jgi:uncharacterized protein (TIGR03545 family)
MEFSRLQVANPSDGWKNMFETGKTKFALNFSQLLRGKLIIETMELNNLIIGTNRTSDGTLPKEEEKEEEKPETAATPLEEESSSLTGTAKSLVQEEVKKTPMFDLDQLKKSLNLDSLLNPNNLATYRRADSLKQQINEAGAQWQTTLTDFEKSKTRLSEIEATAKSINLSNIKTPQDASNMLNNIKTASTNANAIKKTFTERKTVLSDAVNKFSGSIKDR